MRIVVALIAAYYAYAAVLASVCLLHDETLLLLGRLVRLVGVWLFPFIGALFVLRSTAEVSPQSLPARPWSIPLVPLLRVNPNTGDAFPDGYDQVQVAEQQQPGQTRY
jgi:hypothetical protein